MRGPMASALLAAGEFVGIARAEQIRAQADLYQNILRHTPRLGARLAVHHRAKRDGILDRHARIERGVAVLEHHLHLAAQGGDGDAARGRDRLPVEHQLAGIGHDQMQQQAREGGFSAAGLTDDAQRLTLEQGEGHAVDGAHHGTLAGTLDTKMPLQGAHDQHGLRGTAAIARVDIGLGCQCGAHSRTSIAARTPSLTRLKQIEVMKMAIPGMAQPSGST
jgi:hypothetical protein